MEIRHSEETGEAVFPTKNLNPFSKVIWTRLMVETCLRSKRHFRDQSITTFDIFNLINATFNWGPPTKYKVHRCLKCILCIRCLSLGQTQTIFKIQIQRPYNVHFRENLVSRTLIRQNTPSYQWGKKAENTKFICLKGKLSDVRAIRVGRSVSRRA